MDKSHVGMEYHQCVVCGHTYPTGTVLFDSRLKNSLERQTVTGNGFCPKHQDLKDQGYVALIEIDPSKSEGDADAGTIHHAKAYRTGVIRHIPAPMFEYLMKDASVPEGGIAFVDIEAMTKITDIVNEIAKQQKALEDGDNSLPDSD